MAISVYRNNYKINFVNLICPKRAEFEDAHLRYSNTHGYVSYYIKDYFELYKNCLSPNPTWSTFSCWLVTLLNEISMLNRTCELIFPTEFSISAPVS